MFASARTPGQYDVREPLQKTFGSRGFLGSHTLETMGVSVVVSDVGFKGLCAYGFRLTDFYGEASAWCFFLKLLLGRTDGRHELASHQRQST